MSEHLRTDATQATKERKRKQDREKGKRESERSHTGDNKSEEVRQVRDEYELIPEHLYLSAHSSVPAARRN